MLLFFSLANYYSKTGWGTMCHTHLGASRGPESPLCAPCAHCPRGSVPARAIAAPALPYRRYKDGGWLRRSG